MSDDPVLPDLAAAVEAILFASEEPVTPAEVARCLEIPEREAETAIRRLQADLTHSGRALMVVRIAGGWQLSTRPEHAMVVGRLLARSRARLTRPALETLAIIAYRQPVTGPEIEAIRGVCAAPVLKTLLDRSLIAERGRRRTPGLPMLYGTTPEFLDYFGLAAISDLPPPDCEAASAGDSAPSRAAAH